jgi:hypothetical protein
MMACPTRGAVEHGRCMSPEMSWEALGAIAEAVGAAGVIVTLVYLAVQIRAGDSLIDIVWVDGDRRRPRTKGATAFEIPHAI